MIPCSMDVPFRGNHEECHTIFLLLHDTGPYVAEEEGEGS